jgi:replicative DNA helicase
MFNFESAEKGKAELIIGKNRHGPTGSFPLTFIKEYTRFENFADDDVAEME